MGNSTDAKGNLKPGWFTIDTKPFIKEVKRNIYKRIDLFMVQTPLISYNSLFNLCASLFFNSGRKGKAKIFQIRKNFIGPLTYQDTINYKESLDITVKIKLRVLMCIGPKSGLWYPSLHVINYLYGNGILFFYRNMFCLAVYHWFENKIITKKSDYKLHLLERIKYNSYSRIHVVSRVVKAFKDFWDWFKVCILLQFTFVVDFKGNNPRIPTVYNVITPFTIIILPQIIIICEGIKVVCKVLKAAISMAGFYMLTTLWNLTVHKTNRILLGVFLMVIVLVFDLSYYSWILPFLVYFITSSVGFKRMMKQWIYFSPIYNDPVTNIIADKTAQIFDPFESDLTTLAKVVSEKKLESSGAWLNIVNLLRHKRSVRLFLDRQKQALLESKKGSGKVAAPKITELKTKKRFNLNKLRKKV
jgi:hypothetical protein